MTSDLDLCGTFVVAHPRDAARVLERLPAEDVAALLDAMPPGTSARAFEQMTPTTAAGSLQRMRTDAAAALVAGLRSDLAASLLRRVDSAVQAAVLERLPQAEARVLRAVLRYPEGTAGALMDPRAIAVADDVAAREALAAVRRSPRDRLSYLFVVDRAHRLAGVADLGELMQARPGDLVAAIMDRSVSRLPARTGRAGILAHPGWRRFHTLPVVDEESRFVGAIRYEVFRALEDDAEDKARRQDAVTTVVALGELYWLGLSSVLDGLASIVKRNPAHATGRAEADRGNA